MTLMSRMLDPLAAARGPLDDYWYYPISMPAASGITVTAETALALSAVYACTRIIAEDVGKLPLHVFERRSDGGKTRAQNHPLYDLLHDAPNDWQTAQQFREMLTGHAVLRGNGYAYIQSGQRGFADQLIPLHPACVEVEQLDNRRLRYHYTQPDGTKVVYPQERIFHLRGLSDNGVTGLSIIALARETLGLAAAAERFSARFFGHGTRPSGYLKFPGKLSSKQARDRMAQSWQSAYGGVDNSHKTPVLEEGLEWVKVGVDPEEAQMLETRKFQKNEIATWFRMPPHKIGDMERATFCLPADVQVYTETGPVSVRDVRPGTLVWSRGKHGLELASAVAVAQTGYARVLTVRTTNRTLRLTANHRVLVRRRVLSAATSRVGGVVTADGWARLSWATEWARADELRVGDTLVSLSCLPEHGTTHAPTRPHVSIGFMEFCGLLLGDGWVSDAGVSIARAKDAPYMSYYREVIRSEFKKRGGQPVVLQELERMTRFSSVTASRELRELGLSGSARTKQVPAWVFRLDEERKLAFIRGFLDADGSVDKEGRIAFHSVNQGMLSQIRHICMGLGIPVTNMRNVRGTTKLPNGEESEFDMWTFTCSNPGANRRIWSHDPRYQDRLLAGRPFNRKGRNYPRYGGHDFAEDGYELGRINSIAEGELLEPVYDLQVAGNESFIANGVVVHNSNIEHQALEYVIDTLMPWLVRWEQAIKRDLIVARDRFFAEHVIEGLLRGDIKSRFEAYQIAILNSWMTPNEVRLKENMNPRPELDEFFMQRNMQRISDPSAPAPARQQAKLLAVEAAKRVVRKEIVAVGRMAKRHAGDPAAWRQAVAKFYEGHVAHVAETLHIGEGQAWQYVQEQRDAVLRDGADAMLDWETDRIAHLVDIMLEGEGDG